MTGPAEVRELMTDGLVPSCTQEGKDSVSDRAGTGSPDPVLHWLSIRLGEIGAHSNRSAFFSCGLTPPTPEACAILLDRSPRPMRACAR